MTPSATSLPCCQPEDSSVLASRFVWRVDAWACASLRALRRRSISALASSICALSRSLVSRASVRYRSNSSASARARSSSLVLICWRCASCDWTIDLRFPTRRVWAIVSVPMASERRSRVSFSSTVSTADSSASTAARTAAGRVMSSSGTSSETNRLASDAPAGVTAYPSLCAVVGIGVLGEPIIERKNAAGSSSPAPPAVASSGELVPLISRYLSNESSAPPSTSTGTSISVPSPVVVAISTDVPVILPVSDSDMPGFSWLFFPFFFLFFFPGVFLLENYTYTVRI